MTVAVKTLITFGLIFLATVSGWAMDINPGQSRTECPGILITLGGNGSRPTAGPEPLESYIIQWSCSPGSWTSSEANPEIAVPDVKTVYTVSVTDADGFTCRAFVTITPVIISSIKFNPETLPADGQSTSQATATTDAPGRTFVWSITELDGTGSSIGETNGLVTAGTQQGTIRVKAQDKEAAESKLQSCAAEENLCIGDPKDCCPDITGDIMFGLIKVKLTEAISPVGVADAEGYCPYATNKVRVNISMEGFFPTPISYDLEGVNVSWSEKMDGGTRRFKDAKLTWDGKAPTRKFGALMANLTHMNVGVTSEGVISGETTFTINQVEPVNLFGNFAVLAKGTSGEFTFRYSSSPGSGYQGEYDFGGVKNVVIQLRKTKIIAEAKGSLNSAGDLTAEFIAKDPVEYGTNGFKATLKKLSWKFTWKISDNDLVFKNGQADLLIKEIKNTKGELDIKVDLKGTEALGVVTFENLSAFGFKIEGKLNAAMSYDLELKEIEGTGILATHQELEGSFGIREFRIVNGELTVFDFNARAKYKSVFFDISSASYRSDKSALSLTALVKIGNSADLQVTDFYISGKTGGVSIGAIKLEITQFPITIAGSLSITPQGFAGTYAGKIEGGIGIGGKVVMGSQDDFNYGFFELEMRVAKGFPVGPIIRIDELSGKFGYNYSHTNGRPSLGTYVIGFGIGIKDAANLVGLEGSVELVIGKNSAVTIGGQVRVPAKSPHYFNGSLEITYFLGTHDLKGKAKVGLKVPARSGSIISLNSGSVDFRLSDAGWSVNADGMTGNIMNQVTITTSIDLKETNSNSDGINGRLTGAINFSKEIKFIYPKGFNSENCLTADATDSFLGFGIDGYLHVVLGGGFDAQINPEGFVGAIKANASGRSRIKVKWPCVTCVDCLKTGDVSISGELEIKHGNGTTILEGELTFQEGDESETEHVEMEF